MRLRLSFAVLYILLCSLFAFPGIANAQNDSQLVITLQVDGPLTPSLAGYIARGISAAERQNAELIVLQLNTPGGSIDLMNRIVQNIRSSSIPIVVYVSPSGAMAGSAGTIITLAGHLAAMAPETAIGAASPVGGQGEDLGETIALKEKEMLRATIRSLASNRGDKAIALAEDTVENAKAVSVQEALSVGLIDMVATDMNDLLGQLNGKSVTVLNEVKTIDTTNLIQNNLEMSFIEQVLQLLTNPNILFLLLTIGVQAIFIELSHPGGWVAGFIGAVCLILAIYGMGVLPVNWFGFLFLAVAFILFVLEVKAMTHGALAATGALSFVVGSLVLFNSLETPGFPKVSVPLVIITGILLAAGVITILSFAWRAMRQPVRTGMNAHIGQHGYVITTLNPRGTVQTSGELWSAIAEDNARILEGSEVIVTGYKGINLLVKVKSLDNNQQ